LAAALLFLVIGGRAEAVVSVNVPLDHPAYRWAEQLVARGAVDSAFLTSRPWTRRTFARLIGGAEREKSNLGPVGRRYLVRLEHVFASELREVESGAAGGYIKPLEEMGLRVGVATGEPEAVLEHGDSVSDGTDVRLDWQAHARLGRFLAVAIRPELRGSGGTTAPLRRHGIHGALPDADETGWKVVLRESYAKLRLWNVELEAGRDHLWWGPARRGAILVSDNTEPFDLIKLSNPDPVLLPWVLRYLGPIRVDWFWTELEHARTVPRAQLTGLRIAFKPTPNWEVGLERVVQFGGFGRPGLFDQGVLHAVSGVNDQGSGNDTENSIAALNFVYRFSWPVAGQAYWDWGGEDQSKLLGVVPFFHDRGWIMGLYLPQPFASIPAGLRFEWFKDDFAGDNPNVFYNHSTYRSGYTYRGKVIGHPFGSFAESYSVRVDTYPADSLDLGFDFDWVKNGLDGAQVKEKDLRFGLDGVYYQGDWFRWSARYDFEQRQNAGNVSGDDETSHRVTLGVTLDL